MKRVRFLDPAGIERRGRLADGRITFGDAAYAPEDVYLLPPVAPTKLVPVGPNYASHLDHYPELDTPQRPADLAMGLQPPTTLTRPHGTSSLTAGNEYVYGAELGAVIGEQCKDVPVEAAGRVIKGYVAANDITHMVENDGNVVAQKAFDGSTPVSPALSPPEDVPADATMELHVDGELAVSGTRSNMLFDERALIAEISQHMTLEPDDVILTGSPGQSIEAADGDAVDVRIEGIEPLRHTVGME